MGIKISGVGCSLLDTLYMGVDFNSDAFKRYESRKIGDGGLSPGKLVFSEDIEGYSGEKLDAIVRNIVGDRPPDSVNLGGPAIVALINAAQLLENRDASIQFYGLVGDDEIGKQIISIISKTPVNIDNYKKIKGSSPFTEVFSDPTYADGQGERTFINNIGTSYEINAGNLPDSFYDADIILAGATALVPNLHEELTEVLAKGKERGCITVVTTVYDFLNDRKNPDTRWPLGKSDDSYRLTDILIVDREEALRLSGQDTCLDAIDFFRKKRLGACIITQGAEDILFYSNGDLFKKNEVNRLPISEAIRRDVELRKDIQSDTTGCGDNFAGGVLASIAVQNEEQGGNQLDLTEACSWGVVSGGFACFYMGGTYHEVHKGDKLEHFSYYLKRYEAQTGIKA